MDFNQTCTDILLRDAKEVIRFFGDLDPIFKVTGGQEILKNTLFALYLMKG